MSACAPKYKRDLKNHAKWANRPHITPKLIVLHSTESSENSGEGVANYLAHLSVQADCHYIVDSDADVYRLVPDTRKAWHVAAYNSIAVGIEQVGRAFSTVWHDTELNETAKLLAFISYHKNIPLRDARLTYRFGGKGVVTHKSLGQAGGGHVDPGPNYPFRRVLRKARRYKRVCYGSVLAHA